MKKEHKESAKVVAGTGATSLGAGYIIKSFKTKKISPKKEVVEIVEEIKPKTGEYLAKHSQAKKALRKAERRAEMLAAGQRGAGWIGAARRVFSEKSEMVIKKKQDKNDIERAGKIVEKSGVITAGLGAAGALGGLKIAKKAAETAEKSTGAALNKALRKEALGNLTTGLGAKATKTGLTLAGIGLATKAVGKKVRKQREEEKTKKK